LLNKLKFLQRKILIPDYLKFIISNFKFTTVADFLKASDVLSNLHLKSNMTGAEFGCGSAEIAITLAKILDDGRVYALDIQEEKLSALKGKLSQQKVSNIVTVLCDLEAEKGSTLQENSIDVVILANILFQADNKHAIINEAKRVLKKDGQILVIDWLKKSSFGPEKIMAPEEVKNIAAEFGLSVIKEFSSGEYHYGLIFKNNE